MANHQRELFVNYCAYADSSNRPIDIYRGIINRQAKIANVPPCALAAIVEIESGGVNRLQEGMPRGPGCGVGLCQITYDVNWKNPTEPTYADRQLLTPSDNLFVAAKFFLRPALDMATALRDVPDNATWMQTVSDQLLYWAFAAYNGGTTFVTTCVNNREDPDLWTTDRYASRALLVYERNVAKALS